jgi:hypothetical protein
MTQRPNPLRRVGTRFHLFPSYAEGYSEPELVEVSLPPGSIGPGPSDPWMYTRNAISKDEPYDPPSYAPPYRGSVYPPAFPGRRGHFNEIAFGTEQFLAAHTYGTVRLVLDIWERYLARTITWWHADLIPRVELIPIVHWQNAQSGPGFIEMGQEPNKSGRLQPFCLNFDVLAHETGHAILFSQIGMAPYVTEAFLAFHESFADLISMIAVLHFRSVRVRLLQQTWGNLYSLNVLTRFGEYSDTQQIRVASNQTTMAEVDDIHLEPDGSWFDPTGQNRNQHAIAEPLTGAVFSALVEIYQDELVSRGLITPELDARGWTPEDVQEALSEIHLGTGSALRQFEDGFYAALNVARHIVGRCMAHVILTIRPETLNFAGVAARFLEAAVALGQARNLPALMDHFVWRGIDPRPLLAIDAPARPRQFRGERRGRLRMVEAPNLVPGCQCLNRTAFVQAHRLMPHPHRIEGETPV